MSYPIPNKAVWIAGAEQSFIDALGVAIAAASPALYVDQQTITGTEFTVAENGGILPASDQKIAILWDNGVIPTGDVTIDRISEPNTITFADPASSNVITVIFFA